MRILYFVQYFNLPHEPGGSRPYQLAKAWVAEGHEVTVVTGAVNHKTLSVPERYRGRFAVEESVEGIRLLRCWSYAGIRGSFRKRLLNFASFAASAALVALARGGGADLVYASSTPLTVGLPGRIVAALMRVPFVFELRDLWPQSAVVAGVLRENARGTRLAAARRLYRGAARVVGVTRGIGEGLVAEGVPREKVLFVPNGVDDWMVGIPPAVSDAAAGAPLRVVYCGALGRWNGMGQVLDAAALLRFDPSITFELIGDGDDAAKLAERAAAERLTNVVFRGALPKREAFEALRSAGALIVVTWDHPFQRMVLANKIFDYLAASRPVVAGAAGEMATLIDEAGCGIVVPPERPAELAAALRRIAALPAAERDAMGARGRAHILAHYRRDHLAARLLAVFQQLVDGAGGAPAAAATPALDRKRP